MTKHFFNSVRELAEYMATLEPNEEKGTIEATNITFVADSGDCIGTSSPEYRAAELGWFISADNNIRGLGLFNGGKIPKIWQDIAERDGEVNSNYGYRCLHPKNGDGKLSQFELAMKQLILDKNSRRGIMVYNFPGIHEKSAIGRDNSIEFTYKLPDIKETAELERRREKFKKLKTDFMCCQNSIFSIEGDTLNMSNMMRSLDLRFGLPHDWEWWNYAFDLAVTYLKPYYPEIKRGTMYVSAVSAHVYERHYHLLDKFKKPEKSLEEELIAKHIEQSRNEWIKQEREMNKSFFTTPSNWTKDIKVANFENPQNSSALKPYCSIEVPKAPFIAARENLFDKIAKHENALDKEDEAGEPAYFGSPSYAVHGGEPLNKKVDGIDISGDSRYKANTIEHWDVAIAHKWNYVLGCATKYVYRNRFKGQQAADLGKIKEYARKHVEVAAEAPAKFLRFRTATMFLEEEVDGLTDMELGMVRAIEAMHCSTTIVELSDMYHLLCAFVEAVENNDTSKLVNFAPFKKEMDYILTRKTL